MASRVLLKIVYLLTRRMLGLAVLVVRSDRAKDAELLVLRHENAVLRRHVGRMRYEPDDRVWFASLRLPMMHRYQWAGPKKPSNTAHCWLVWERGAAREYPERFNWKELLGNAAKKPTRLIQKRANGR